VRRVRYDADDPRRLPQYHGVRTPGPRELETGGDQAGADVAARAPSSRECCFGVVHRLRITMWTLSTKSS